MMVLAYMMSILTGLAERKQKRSKKKTYKDGRTFDAISVFKQGQSLMKQRFITRSQFLDLVQFLNVIIKIPIPHNKLFVQ